MITDIQFNGESISLIGPVAVIPSRSEPGTFRTVYGGVCDCPAGQHGRTCWHVQVVRQLGQTVLAAAQPVPTTPAPTAEQRQAAIRSANQDIWGDAA